ncbi:MAG TPA: hypothetical protein VGJ18_16950, partial [Gemmatimonadaceae bacterium]
ADVWAFGCVLFEMLTGQRAFTGENVTDVLSRVLQREPDFDALSPVVRPRTPVAPRHATADSRSTVHYEHRRISGFCGLVEWDVGRRSADADSVSTCVDGP